MFIIAGLGNPGRQYQMNRHNIGFMAVDEIKRHYDFHPWSKKFQAEVASGTIGNQKVLLLKPQTFMNLSGQAIGEALRFYKADCSDLYVLHDEMDLAPGKLRVKFGGGSGGHNGIKSIDNHCGKEYHRLRLGIGHPISKELVHNYVLGDFSKDDQSWLDQFLSAIANHIGLLLANEDSSFMNRVALAMNEGDKKSPSIQQSSKPKQQSHIIQARPNNKPKLPSSGPMADLLKKLFPTKD